MLRSGHVRTPTPGSSARSGGRESSMADGTMDPNEELFDTHAPSYAETVNGSIAFSGEDVSFFASRKVREVLRWMRSARFSSPRHVLDFGCGTGLSTAALGDALGAGCEVTGVDVSSESIRAAVANHDAPNLRFVQGGAATLPFEDECFDMVFTSCVFHHIDREKHQHWMHELRRVLRAGGVAFVFEHNPFNPLTVRAVHDCPFDEGVVLLSPRYARELIEASGFAAERPRFYFFFPGLLRALRPLEPWMDRLPIGAQYFVVGRRSERPDATG